MVCSVSQLCFFLSHTVIPLSLFSRPCLYLRIIPFSRSPHGLGRTRFTLIMLDGPFYEHDRLQRW
jgi:hypothetical protein